jgi:gliding motility-associated protein GldE
LQADGFPVEGLAMLLLLFASAFVSGSEVAFFSIDKPTLTTYAQSPQPSLRAIARLLHRPRRLLATILISNNLINIAIVILSTRLVEALFVFEASWVAFTVNVVLTTFLLVLFGEVIPKVYANQLNLDFAQRVALPMLALDRVLSPLSRLLASSTQFIEKRFQGKANQVSMHDLRQALELAVDQESTEEEKNILRGVLSFSQTTVKQVMTTRVDVIGLENDASWADVVRLVDENRYSRVPVYQGTFDHILGILYIKDLIPYLYQDTPQVKWQRLLRDPYYVPESKTIDELLRDFQEKKVHMAIVVDEYGGSSGIVTLEDVLEEIVGEINDEYDFDEATFTQIDENNYVFDGKASLKDVVRVMELAEDTFADLQGEVETIGGLAVEVCGRIPTVGKEIHYQQKLALRIEARDRKKVKRVKITRTADEPTTST